MVIDATKKQRVPEFEMAEKVGVKEPMVEALNSIIKEYKGKMPESFGVEELYYMIDQGMVASGVKPNFKVRSIMVLARAFLHGYLVGKKIKGD